MWNGASEGRVGGWCGGGGGERGRGWTCGGCEGRHNDNAHACQQGGGAGLLDENEFAFKNAGDCASHGAKGSAYTGLSVVMNAYNTCSNDPHITCYGTVTGSGMQPNQPVGVILNFSDGSSDQQNPSADGNGNLSYPLNIVCDESPNANEETSVEAFGTTAGGTNVDTGQVGTPCG